MDEIIERVALALKEDRENDIRRWYASSGSIAPNFPAWEKDGYIWMQQARAAIEAYEAALADAGAVIVPRKLTEAMIKAAFNADGAEWSMQRRTPHGGPRPRPCTRRSGSPDPDC